MRVLRIVTLDLILTDITQANDSVSCLFEVYQLILYRNKPLNPRILFVDDAHCCEAT